MDFIRGSPMVGNPCILSIVAFKRHYEDINLKIMYLISSVM